MKIRFYHIPKSGGTAVFNMTRKWKNFRRAHRKHNHVCICWHPPAPDEIGMAVIRHPYSRFESAFYHMVDACNDHFYYRNAPVSDCNALLKMGIADFKGMFNNDPNEFLYALVNRSSPFHTKASAIFNQFDIFKSQFHWLSDVFGISVHPGLKIILNQENLKDSFTQLASELGHTPEWDERYSNRRLTQDTRPLTSESKAILQKVYANDFKHFKFPV